MVMPNGIPNSREILRSVDDGELSLQWESRLGRSLDNFFNGREYDTDYTTHKKVTDLDDKWTTSLGPLSNISQYLAIYSRRAFKYPFLVVSTTLTAPVAGASSWIGLENGSQGYYGYFAVQGSGASNWALRCRSLGHTAAADLDVQALLPAAYDTAQYQYGFKLNKNNAEWFSSGAAANLGRPLRGIILHGLSESIPEWEAEPYALGGLCGPMPSDINTLIEIGGSVSSFTCDVSQANDFVCQDGDPLPPRQYIVFTENTTTKWQALATAGALVTSHPVPIWGYENAKLAFIADAAGTLTVQAYLNGAWRSVATPTVTGNTLLTYDLAANCGGAPIVRFTYDPTNGDTITMAQVNMW